MIKEKVRRFYRWYILGYFHCDHCPYSWESRNYFDGDADAGCCIYGDIRDTCRLLPPFRWLLGKPRQMLQNKLRDHEYDDMPEWCEQQEREDKALRDAIQEAMVCYEFCCRDWENGSLIPACRQEVFDSLDVWEIRRKLDAVAHPAKPVPTLKEEWKGLIRKTWQRFIYRLLAPLRSE